MRENDGIFRRFVENSKDLIYRMSLPDGRYEYISPAVEKITGYTAQEFYTSPLLIREIIHPDWLPYLEEQWEKLLAGDMPPQYEYQIIHKSGEIRWINQRNTLIHNEHNEPVAIEGILTDVTERKRDHELLQLAYEEKRDLLRELQHRAKNSFNMLTSIIELLADSDKGEETKEVLGELSTKIRAVSEMYTLLFQSDSQTEINLRTYLTRIRDYVQGVSDNIEIRQSLSDITLSTKSAIPVGLITAELLTNSVKHAFHTDGSGVITISLEQAPGGACLSVKDDGIGLPEGFDMMSTNSLGLKLVSALTDQLGGSFRMGDDKGTFSVLEFPIDWNSANSTN